MLNVSRAKSSLDWHAKLQNNIVVLTPPTKIINSEHSVHYNNQIQALKPNSGNTSPLEQAKDIFVMNHIDARVNRLFSQVIPMFAHTDKL